MTGTPLATIYTAALGRSASRFARITVMAVHAHEMRTLLAMLETEEAHELVCEAYTFGFPLHAALLAPATRSSEDAWTPPAIGRI